MSTSTLKINNQNQNHSSTSSTSSTSFIPTSPISCHSNELNLSERIRKLAYSIGNEAIHDFEDNNQINNNNTTLSSPLSSNNNNHSPTRRSSQQLQQLPSSPISINNSKTLSPHSTSSSNNRELSSSLRSNTPNSDNGLGLEDINELDEPNESKYEDEQESTFQTNLNNYSFSNNNSNTTNTAGQSLGLINNYNNKLEEFDQEFQNDAFNASSSSISSLPSKLEFGLPVSKEVEQLNMIRDKLKRGETKIEVKVWLVDGELLYGKDEASLSPANTLYSGYIHPLQKLLTAKGDYQKGHHRRLSSTSTFSHITSTSPVHLIISLQNEPSPAFSYLLHEIEPLHDDSLLTTFCSNSILTSPGLITIFLTGKDVPKEEISSINPRYVFEWSEEIQNEKR